MPQPLTGLPISTLTVPQSVPGSAMQTTFQGMRTSVRHGANWSPNLSPSSTGTRVTGPCPRHSIVSCRSDIALSQPSRSWCRFREQAKLLLVFVSTRLPGHMVTRSSPSRHGVAAETGVLKPTWVSESSAGLVKHRLGSPRVSDSEVWDRVRECVLPTGPQGC